MGSRLEKAVRELSGRSRTLRASNKKYGAFGSIIVTRGLNERMEEKLLSWVQSAKTTLDSNSLVYVQLQSKKPERFTLYVNNMCLPSKTRNEIAAVGMFLGKKVVGYLDDSCTVTPSVLNALKEFECDVEAVDTKPKKGHGQFVSHSQIRDMVAKEVAAQLVGMALAGGAPVCAATSQPAPEAPALVTPATTTTL